MNINVEEVNLPSILLFLALPQASDFLICPEASPGFLLPFSFFGLTAYKTTGLWYSSIMTKSSLINSKELYSSNIYNYRIVQNFNRGKF